MAEKKAKVKPKFSESLAKLSDQTQPFPISALYAFSNLTEERQAKLERVWVTLEEKRRQKIAADLADLAEVDIELEFSEVFYILLKDVDPKVRSIAIEALWEDESLLLLQKLLKLMENDPNPGVREKATIAVGRFALLAELKKLPERWIRRVREALFTQVNAAHRTPEIERRAIEGLAYFSTDPDVKVLITHAYKSEDEHLKGGALRAMGRNVDKRWLPEIGKEISNREPALRYEATMAAGELGSEQLLQLLVERTKDSDQEVRLAAVWSLGQIGGVEARRAIDDLIRGDSAELSEAAKEALKEMEIDEFNLSLDTL